MQLDIIDFEIIKFTMLQKNLTSTKIAQLLFGPMDVYQLRNKDALIRERSKKLLKYGLLERVIKNNISYWNIGKAVFTDIPIYVDKKKVKFLGVVIKVKDRYIIHGISE